jgi:hypothetical protein
MQQGMPGRLDSLFVWLISHQPPVLFSQNKSATSQQYFSLTTNQHQPSATGQTNMLEMKRCRNFWDCGHQC